MSENASPNFSSRAIFGDCVLLLLVALGPALLCGWVHPRRPVWSWVQPAVGEADLSDVVRWSSPVLWVDARTPEAYQRQHIPGAILLDEAEWENRLPAFLEKWQPNSRIVVYCDSAACDASQAVATRLQRELGLTDIHVLKGGWSAWLKNQP